MKRPSVRENLLVLQYRVRRSTADAIRRGRLRQRSSNTKSTVRFSSFLSAVSCGGTSLIRTKSPTSATPVMPRNATFLDITIAGDPNDGRISRRTIVIQQICAVRYGLRGITEHVVKSEGIGLEAADWRSVCEAIIAFRSPGGGPRIHSLGGLVENIRVLAD
jgi:hypothetical protein